jgi:hypothetical protein
MSQENEVIPPHQVKAEASKPYKPHESHDWRDMWTPLVFVIGVPAGIVLGVLTAAVLELHLHIKHLGFLSSSHHPAAWGVVAGFVGGTLVGVVVAAIETTRRFKFESHELETIRCRDSSEWWTLVERLNVRAAHKHYLVLSQQEHYVSYAPTMAAPVAGGPLTVAPREWLTVVVACSNTRVTIAGPKWIARELLLAAEVEAAEPAPTSSEQGAHADS